MGAEGENVCTSPRSAKPTQHCDFSHANLGTLLELVNNWYEPVRG